jgi:hypothetical protein
MPYFEAQVDGAIIFNPLDLIGACLEHGTDGLLLDHGALPASFFDLSSGVAGELLQKLANYGIRMAAVIPDPALHSASFQAFAREANRSAMVRFLPGREEAEAWLSTGD